MGKKISSLFPLIFIIFCYLVVIVAYSGFVPLWDGWETLELWLLKAVREPFNLLNFDNGGHPSMAYFLTLSLGQYLDFGNMKLLYLTNAILYIFSIAAFYGLLRKIFVGEGATKDLFLLTFLFAFYPITLAQTFQSMPDFGVYVFYILFLYFLMCKKRLLAVIVSIGLIFSKEYGLLLFLLSIIGDFWFELSQKKINYINFINSLKSRFIYLFPLILAAIRLMVISLYIHGHGIWQSVDLANPVLYNKSLLPEVIAKIPWSYISVIFIVNFNWILTFFIIMATIYLVRFQKNIFNTKKTELVHIAFIFYLFVASTFLLTIFRTFSNPRYFMPLYPLMIILFYFGLVTIIRQDMMRRVVLSLVVLLFFMTNFMTIDPISKKIYGTFKFGRHEMLKMTSITGECCGYGRDQLVYNLEYTQFHYIINRILADIKPNEETIMVYHPLEGEYVISRIDVKSFERTLKRGETLNPFHRVRNYWYMPYTYYPNNIVYPFEGLILKPKRLYFIEFPNMENYTALNIFGKYYITKDIKIYENLGYEIPVRMMQLIK